MHLRLHFDADLMLFGIIRVRCRRCQRAQDSDGVRAGGDAKRRQSFRGRSEAGSTLTPAHHEASSP